MPQYQDLLDEYSGIADQALQNFETPPFIPLQKQEEVEAASRAKKEDLRPIGYNVAVGIYGDTGKNSGSEIERDLRNMSFPGLVLKYGPDRAEALRVAALEAQDRVREQQEARRSTGQVIQDLAVGVPGGFVTGFTGLGAALVGIGDRLGIAPQGSGVKAAQIAGDISEFKDGLQSDELNTLRSLNRAASALDERDSKAQYEKDLKDGKSLAGLRRLGREAAAGFARSFGDSTIASDTAADAVGSLLSGSVLASGLRKVGRAVLDKGSKAAIASGAVSAGSTGAAKAFDISSKIGAASSLPIAVGLQEGGGAYQQTVETVMQISLEDLAKQSPEFRQLVEAGMSPEQARVEIANTAGLNAAAIAAPVGGAAGVLVRRRESNPFRFGSTGEFAGDLIRETVEEGIQGASGQLSTNLAVSAEANPAQDLIEGVGEATGRGAAAGLLAQGVIGGPGAAVKAPLDVAEFAGRGAAALTQAALAPIVERGERLIETLKQVGPTSVSNIKTAFAGIVESAPQLAERVREASEKLEVMDRLSGLVISKETPPEEALAASVEINRLVREAQDEAVSEPVGEEAPSTIEDKFRGVLASIAQNPTIRAARDKLVELADKIKPTDALTPENIQTVVGVAEFAPEKSDPDINDKILYQARLGNINLPPEQQIALETSSRLVRVQREYDRQAKALNQKSPDVVSESIAVEGLGPKQLSASQHMRRVVDAMRVGNEEAAKLQLDDFMKFARLLQNKVDALNRNLASGKGKAEPTKYQNLTANRAVRLSSIGLYVNPESQNSIRLAQQVENDARAVVTLANSLATSFPQLGIEPLAPVELVSELQGDPDQIAQANRVKRAQSRNASAPVQAQPETQEELPLFRAPPKEQAPEPAETGQPKGGDQSTDGDENVEAIEQPKPAAEPTREKVEDKAPAPVEVEAAPRPEPDQPRAPEPVPEPELTGTKAAYPSLLGSRFADSFRLPSQTRSRTQGKKTPVRLIRDVLRSAKSLEQFLGFKPRLDLTDDIAAEYGKLFQGTARLAEIMQKNLDRFLEKNKGRSLEQLSLFRNGKALNITEQGPDGKLSYNPELLGNALLAGLNWLLNADRYRGARLKAGDIARILQVDELEVDDALVADFNAGMGSFQIKTSLAQQIEKFWGLSANPDADISLVKGISESVAGELIRAMVEFGMVQVNELTDLPGKIQKVNRFVPFELEETNPILGYKTAIEEAVLTEIESPLSLDGPITTVARHQINNPRIQNTPEQRAAARNEQATPYTLNTSYSDLLLELGQNLTVELLGEGNLDNRKLNKQHRKTLEGRNRQIVSSYQTLVSQVSELRNKANRDKIPLDQVQIHYGFNFQSNNRMQMQGLNNPQASKPIREAIRPTKAVLDMTTDRDNSRYGLALAQALGIKVHTMSREAAIEKVFARLGGGLPGEDAPLAPAVTLFREWLVKRESRQPLKLDAAAVEVLKNAFGGKLEAVALHAVLDYARLLNTEDKSKFETRLSVEADGIANGPTMAMMLAAVDGFTPRWVENVAKGGVFFEEHGTPESPYSNNQHRQKIGANNDLYTGGSQSTKKFLSEFRKSILEADVRENFDATIGLMDLFFDSISINEQGELEIDRGLTKNPMTITIYGSGPGSLKNPLIGGIAGKLTGELFSYIYERLSDAMQAADANPGISLAEAMFGAQATETVSAEQLMDRFTSQLSRLVPNKKWFDQDPNFNAVEFKFTKPDLRALATGILTYFVDPLQRGIAETIGQGTTDGMQLIRQATQIQSLIAKQAFKAKLEKAVEGKGPGQFVSQNELNQIYDEVEKLAPFVEAPGQRVDPSGSSRVTFATLEEQAEGKTHPLDRVEFGRPLNDRLDTPGYIRGPDAAGVSGMPLMIISMGDAKMMQLRSTARNPVPGLPVFDGFEMPLDRMEDGSYQINQAAYEAMLGNPLEAVLKPFETTISNLDYDNMPLELVQLLSREFGEFRRLLAPQEIKANIDTFLKDLRAKSQNVEARHRAIRRVRISVDQMAAVGQPYQNEGEDLIDLSGLTPAEIATRLNELAREELLKLRDEAETKIDPENISKALKLTGSVDAKREVITVSPNQLRRMVSQLDIPGEQKTMLKEIVKSLLAKDYTIVTGSFDKLKAWADYKGYQKFPAESVFTGSIQGFTAFGDKTIYLVNPSSETLVHELIHAATFEKLVTYYSSNNLIDVRQSSVFVSDILNQNDKAVISAHFGETQYNRAAHDAFLSVMNVAVNSGLDKVDSKLRRIAKKISRDIVANYSRIGITPSKDITPVSDEEAEAIQRIQSLMDQFLELEDQSQSYRHAKAAIQQYSTKTDPVSKAAALNEFMAWALSNRELIKLQQETEANPLVRLAKAALKAIKALIWGKRHPPKVADDMHSNLLFNTSILLNADPSVQEIINDTLLFQNTNFGTDQHLSEIEDIFAKKIVTHLGATLEDMTERHQVFAQAMTLAIETTQSFTAHGFPMTVQQSSLFKMIVATLATSAQLDPNVLAETQRLFDHVVKTIKVESFMKDPGSNDPNDRYWAQEKFDSVVGNYTPRKDAQGRSTLLSSFLALAMTNPEFREVLKTIPVPNAKLGLWNTLDGVLDNVGVVAMDKLSEAMSGADRSASDVADAMVALSNRLVEVARDRQNWIDTAAAPVGNAIDRTNQFIVDSMIKLTDKVVDGAKKVETALPNKVTQAAVQTANVMAAIVNEEKADAIQLGLISQLNRSKIFQPLFDIMNELTGRTSENALIYDMIKLVRSRVQQNRQQFRDHLPQVIASHFSRKLSDDEWTALFKGLAKTDLAVLIDGYDISRIMTLVSDPGQLATEINTLEEKLRSLVPGQYRLLNQKSRELAEFMNTGKVPGNLLRNAQAIASLYGEVRPGLRRPSPEVIKTIDQLVTLYAVETLPAATKAQIQNLIETEAEGVSFTLNYVIGQRRDEQSKVSASPLAQANHYKGYIPAESKAGLSVIVAEDGNEVEMLNQGYKRVADYEGSPAEIGRTRKGYYFSTVGRPMFHQGILQNVRPTASGVDPLTGFTNMSLTGGQITDFREVTRIQRAQRLNANGGEPLMPIFDGDGQVIAYERSVDPQQEIRVQRDTNLSTALGVWHGRQVEEYESVFVNRVLVQRLGQIWDGDKTLRADEYINLFDRDLKDPILRDAVALINSGTRQIIEQQFGPNQFWVRKDMLYDTTGYRQASVGDLWTKNTRWTPEIQKQFTKLAIGVFGPEAYKRMVTAEQFLKNFISDARVTIVVKSVVVPMANLAANFIQLMSRGVPIANIVRGMPRKTAEIETFVRSRVRLIEAEAELRAVRNDLSRERQLKAEIQSIKDAHRRLSIWPLIEAGEFASISDTALSQDEIMLAEGRLNAYIEKLTDKLPDSLKTVGRYALVAKDTALYRGLQRAVEYGDFLGKAILYDDLTKRLKLSREDALAKITEEFVNYDRLPGRARGYLENIGLLWFWHFKIRSTKIAVSILRNNPLHAFMALSMPSALGFELPGSPVTDNGFSVATDGRLGYSLGVGQALHAHQLNPWVNLSGI